MNTTLLVLFFIITTDYFFLVVQRKHVYNKTCIAPANSMTSCLRLHLDCVKTILPHVSLQASVLAGQITTKNMIISHIVVGGND